MHTTVRRFLKRLWSAGIFACLLSGLTSSLSYSQLALGLNKFLGNAITFGWQIPSDYLTYWDQVTPGNDGKWGSVENTQGVYNWGGLDALYNLAQTNGILFKDHNLIWGQQQPSWIGNIDSASQRAAIKAWIDTVGHRYPKMDFIDVVNEPINAPPDGQNGRPNYMRAIGGTGTTGWDWVVTAFTWARQSCAPGVKLLINEYNILQDNARTNTYIALIDTLKVRGLIDGIGIQCHYFELKDAAYLGSRYTYSVATLKANLDKIGSSTGLPIYISEFDIDEKDPNTQLQNYKTYFPLFWTNPGVKGITLWGYKYGDTWKPYAYLDSLGTPRPAMVWLQYYLSHYLEPPSLVSPMHTTEEPRNPVLIWHNSTAASKYRVQVATSNAFSVVVNDTTTADTLVRVPLLTAQTTYYWRVVAMNASDTGYFSAPSSFTTGDSVATSVQTSDLVPAGFNLAQNFPNPFNPSTNIVFELPSKGYVRLRVYDLLGRTVATLVDGEESAGVHSVMFHASRLTSGLYFYRLVAGAHSETRRMLLLK